MVAAAAAVAASIAAGTDLVGNGSQEPAPSPVRALPATEGLPVYGLSPSRLASLLR
jgi:hypothetical protein